MLVDVGYQVGSHGRASEVEIWLKRGNCRGQTVQRHGRKKLEGEGKGLENGWEEWDGGEHEEETRCGRGKMYVGFTYSCRLYGRMIKMGKTE